MLVEHIVPHIYSTEEAIHGHYIGLKLEKCMDSYTFMVDDGVVKFEDTNCLACEHIAPWKKTFLILTW